MDQSQVMNIIIQTINKIFQTIFSSIDYHLYSVLDTITFLDPNFLESSYLEKFFGSSSFDGILLISNSLIFGFLLYYIVKLILANLSISEAERPSKFLLKLLFFAICMNSSFFLCKELFFFTSAISSSIKLLGEQLFHTNISFSNLVVHLNSIISIEESSLNIFSIDGMLKSMISISFINLTFSYSIRYILLQVFVLISPFAFLCLSLPNTHHFFRSWFQCFISLLLVQVFVALVLVLIFAINFHSTNILSKFLICGSVFVLIRANSYIREFLGGLNTEFTSGIQQFSSKWKG